MLTTDNEHLEYILRTQLDTPLSVTEEHIENQSSGDDPCNCAIHDALFEGLHLSTRSIACYHDEIQFFDGDADITYECTPEVAAWQCDNSSMFDEDEDPPDIKPVVLVFNHDTHVVSME